MFSTLTIWILYDLYWRMYFGDSELLTSDKGLSVLNNIARIAAD